MSPTDPTARAMTGEVAAISLFAGPARGLVRDAVLRHEGGVITGIAEGVHTPSAPRRFVMPALVNAHDHARPTASSFGAMGMPLETWLPYSVVGTPPDPYLVAASALARSARGGCASVMVHYTRLSGTMAAVDEARAIVRAGADVGVRVAFALGIRDQNPLVYGDHGLLLSRLPEDARHVIEDLFLRAPLPAADYVAVVDEIAAAVAGPMVDVQFGPAGVQWCSHALLEAVAERSAATGRRVHMHLLETRYQRTWADRTFPGGVVRYLRDIGLLSERTTLAHCIYATPDELDLIAESGARIVTNFSSNMHVASGLAPIAEAHRRGCPIAVGVDGLALDEDDDAVRETRLVRMAHGGTGFERTWTTAEFLGLAVANGRRATGAPGSGVLAPGEPADFLVIDLERLDRDAIMPVDPLDLLFARGNAGYIREVVVAGRTVVRDGRPTGVDLDAIERELRTMYRQGVRDHAFLKAWPPLATAVADWYRGPCGCS